MVTGQSTEEAKGWKSRKMKTSEGHRKAANLWFFLMMCWFMALLSQAARCGTNEISHHSLLTNFFLFGFHFWICNICILAPIPGWLCNESWRCWPWRWPSELRKYFTTHFWRVFCLIGFHNSSFVIIYFGANSWLIKYAMSLWRCWPWGWPAEPRRYHWPLAFDEFCFLVLFSIDNNNIFCRQFQVDNVMSHGAAGHSGSQPNFEYIPDHSLLTSFFIFGFQ